MGFIVAEEVVCALDFLVGDGDPLLLAQLADQGMCVLGRGHAVGGAVHDQPGRRARRKEAEIIHVGRGRHADEAGDFRAAHQKLHPDPGAEAEARDPAMLAVGVHRLQVIQGRCRIRQFADPLVELALAAPHPAKVEAHHGEAQLVECVMEVIDDAVVHRPAILRVRVQDDGKGGVGLARLRVISALEPAFGTGKNQLWHRLPST